MRYNIYCDESCHLQNDKNDIMILGAVFCPQKEAKIINREIRKIKEKHKIGEKVEVKWQKVSNNKIDFYMEIIEFFFSNEKLKFRGVVASGKQGLKLEQFNLTYDAWYYRMYYLLLKEIVDVDNEYDIYMDVKDTLGGEKIKKLKEVLNCTLFSFYEEVVKKVQLVRSDEIEIIQLADILLGAVAYVNRNLNNSNNAKSKVINLIFEKTGQTLKHTTTPKIRHNKFDIFRWAPQRF